MLNKYSKPMDLKESQILTCLESHALPFCSAYRHSAATPLPEVLHVKKVGWSYLSQNKHNEENCTTVFFLGDVSIAFIFPVFEPEITPGPLTLPPPSLLWKYFYSDEAKAWVEFFIINQSSKTHPKWVPPSDNLERPRPTSSILWQTLLIGMKF